MVCAVSALVLPYIPRLALTRIHYTVQEQAGSTAGGHGEEGEEGGGRAGELQLRHGPEAPRLQRQGQPASGTGLPALISFIYFLCVECACIS